MALKEIDEIAEALEYLISEDNTETQFDYVEEILGAIAILRQIKRCFQNCAYEGSCNGEMLVECSKRRREAE